MTPRNFSVLLLYNSSKLPFKHYYQSIATRSFSPGKLISAILSIYLSLLISGWWFVLSPWFSDGSKKNHWFSEQLFSCCKNKTENFQAFYMSELKAEILNTSFNSVIKGKCQRFHEIFLKKSHMLRGNYIFRICF